MVLIDSYDFLDHDHNGTTIKYHTLNAQKIMAKKQAVHLATNQQMNPNVLFKLTDNT